MRRVLAFFAILAICGALPAIAAANDTAMGGIAGAAYPIENTDVRLESEAIHIVVHQWFAEFRVDFRFVNDGPAQSVRLGFPFAVPNEEEDQMGTEPAAFRAFTVDRTTGRTTPLPLEYEQEIGESDQITGYWVHEVDFPEGESTVRVEYLASPTDSVPFVHEGLDVPDEWEPEVGDAHYTYWLHTGAGWAGTIDRAVVRVTLSPDFTGFGEREALAQYLDWRDLDDDPLADLSHFENEHSGVNYVWTFRDFDPDSNVDDGWMYDLRFGYYAPFRRADGTLVYHAWEDRTASSYLVLGDFQYPAPYASDGNPRTAWAEAAEGSGRGEWVEIGLGELRDVREIRVVPGYAKTEALFYKYNRPRTLDVEFSDGTRTTLELDDEPTLQRFPVEATAEWARVSIGEVYRGTTRDETYLTEIEFGEYAAPMVLEYSDLMNADNGVAIDLPDALASNDATFYEDTSDRTRGSVKPTVGGEDASGREVPWQLLAGLAFVVGLAAGAAGAVLIVRARRGIGEPSSEAEIPS